MKFKQFLLSKNKSYAMLLKHLNLHLGKSKSEAVRHKRSNLEPGKGKLRQPKNVVEIT